MRRRMTFFVTDEEYSSLAAHARKTGATMSRVIASAVRAVASGTITVADDTIIIRQIDKGQPVQHSYMLLTPQPQTITPTNVSRETPVPDVPVDTTEYVLNELGKRHPEGHIARMTEDNDKFMYDMGYTPWKPLGKAK